MWIYIIGYKSAPDEKIHMLVWLNMCSKCLRESAVWSHTFKRNCQKSYPPKYKNPGTLEDVSENTCNTATQTIRPSVEKYLTACQVLATNMTADPLQLPRKLYPAKMKKKIKLNQLVYWPVLKKIWYNQSWYHPYSGGCIYTCLWTINPNIKYMLC